MSLPLFLRAPRWARHAWSLGTRLEMAVLAALALWFRVSRVMGVEVGFGFPILDFSLLVQFKLLTLLPWVFTVAKFQPS